jgi:hypothetical protein
MPRSNFYFANGTKKGDHMEKMYMLHVDINAIEANDSNPGTSKLPLRSIGKALEISRDKLEKGESVKILISGGTYRESLQLKGDIPSEGACLSIERKGNQPVYVKGSDLFCNSYTHISESGVYSYNYIYDIPISRDEWVTYNVHIKDITRHRELFFINSEPLKQVLSYEELHQGAFYIEREKKEVYLIPPQNAVMSNAQIEIGCRACILLAENFNNLSIRGIHFSHAVSIISKGAVQFHNCNNLLIEDCVFEWNNWDGLNLLNCSHTVLKNNRSCHNGASGIGYYRGVNVLFDNNETSFNNWRGVAGGFIDWATGGVKALLMHETIFRNHRSVNNYALGLWLDWDNKAVILEHMTLKGNLGDGLMIEASEGPIEVLNSVIADNGRGVYIASSRNVKLNLCKIYGNHISQISVFGDWGDGRNPKDWETGEQYINLPENTQIRSCIIQATAPSQLLFDQRWHDYETGWNRFMETVESDYNFFYHPECENAFCGKNSMPITLEVWRGTTGNDINSTWQELLSQVQPKIEINAPRGSCSTQSGKPVKFTVKASLARSQIKKIEFYDDGSLFDNKSTRLGETNCELFEFQWINPLPGTHRIFALMTDVNDCTTRSPGVEIHIEPFTGTGRILREYWVNVPGNTINHLVRHAKGFEMVPTGVDYLHMLRTESGWGENYGQRIRGFLCPPETGDYTFYMEGGVDCCLYLSLDDNPSSKRHVAASGQSFKHVDCNTVVRMGAGRKYYLEILHKAEEGLNHIAVLWKGPSIDKQVVDGAYLMPVTF